MRPIARVALMGIVLVFAIVSAMALGGLLIGVAEEAGVGENGQTLAAFVGVAVAGVFWSPFIQFAWIYRRDGWWSR